MRAIKNVTSSWNWPNLSASNCCTCPPTRPTSISSNACGNSSRRIVCTRPITTTLRSSNRPSHPVSLKLKPHTGPPSTPCFPTASRPSKNQKLCHGRVYVRQSSVTQVKHHQESTELQYRLVDRAVDLGWPRERVQVIDEDLGKSGAGHADRQGFQKLIAEIGLRNAGLVISLDASRLARNNRDWHQLLELCSLFGVIIADGEWLYDPGAYHDRLLLGLSGIMSEAELHQIRIRLHQGELQKAARGELRMPLPGGLV